VNPDLDLPAVTSESASANEISAQDCREVQTSIQSAASAMVPVLSGHAASLEELYDIEFYHRYYALFRKNPLLHYEDGLPIRVPQLFAYRRTAIRAIQFNYLGSTPRGWHHLFQNVSARAPGTR
jgi:hypothetical protein